MKLIKDLGMQYATPTSKRKYRYALYECLKCNTHYKSRKDVAEERNISKCKKCSRENTNATHGLSGGKIYQTFKAMRSRCYNTNNTHFKNYGGRGITICDEWLKDRTTFFDWALENGYKENLTIDRIDNDGNYKPENCRFVSRAIQSRNTRLLSIANTSGFRGVSFDKSKNNWTSKICVNNKSINLGRFDYPYTAGYAYDSYVIEHDLEHTRNFTL